MKPSRYNILTALNSEVSVLFNARTGVAVELSLSRVDDYLSFSESNCSDEEFVAALKSLNMAVEDDDDEVAMIRSNYHKSINGSKRLTVTVALTEACNFRCGYCYQHHENTKEDAAIEESLLRLLRDAKPDSFNALHINWFGGEPLLKIDFLEKLTEAASDAAKSANWKFTQFITTNGSLLNADRAHRLSRIGIQSYQITLDGPESFHNFQRPRKGGEPSYRLVIDGIGEALKVGASVIVRVNLSRPIADNVDSLLADLGRIGCNRGNTTIHIVRAIDHVEGKVDSFYLSNKEFAHAWIKCLQKIKNKGYRIPHLLPIPYNCSFDTGKTVFIDHRGAHGLCTSIPSIETSANNGGSVPIRFFQKHEKGERYGVKKRDDSFFESDCGSCKFLPACGGGCQYLEAAGQEKCTPERYVFEDLIRLHYSN